MVAVLSQGTIDCSASPNLTQRLQNPKMEPWPVNFVLPAGGFDSDRDEIGLPFSAYLEAEDTSHVHTTKN
jgi:hypothetical protein